MPAIETLPPPDIQVLTSNLCMPPATLFLGGARAYENHANAIGVDGYEITPVYSRFLRGAMSMAKKVKIETLEAAGRSVDALEGLEFGEVLHSYDAYDPPAKTERYAKLIKSAHGTFREEMILDQEPLSFRALPKNRESMGVLDTLRYATGFQLDHFVLYQRELDQPSDYRLYSPLFEDVAFQPKARDWKGLWGLSEGTEGAEVAASPRRSNLDLTFQEEVMDAMYSHGFTSITWDVFHSQVQSKNGEKFDDPLLLAQRLSTYNLVNSVHVALNRQDCAQDNPKLAQATREAQAAFMESTSAALETDEGKMLWHIVQDWKRMEHHSDAERFVVLEEAPEITLQASRIQDRQAAIVNSIRGIIARAN